MSLQQVEPGPSMNVPVSFVTTSDGVRLAYAQTGAGLPVVFVRAWITHLERQWNESTVRSFFEALSEQCRVIRYDARGNGLSERDVGKPDLDAFVSDVEAVADASALDEFAIWGSCFGGPIAIAYAARHPTRVTHVVLDGTYPTWIDLRTSDQRESVVSMVRMLRSAPEVAAAALSYVTDPRPVTRHEDRARRVLESIEPDYLAYLYHLAAKFEVKDLAASLVMPTLVLHRRQSRVFPVEGARLLAAAIPRAQYVELDGVAHNPWEGDVNAVLGAVCPFLGVPVVRAHATRPNAVTVVLFTDLVGSTELADRLGDDVGAEMRRTHDEIATRCANQSGGTIVKHTGDGLFVRFGTASAALVAGRTILQHVEAHNTATTTPGLSLRVGISAGEPADEDGDLFGSAVNLAARVCAAAHPNEVLLTGGVHDLAIGKGFVFESRGAVTLKGFADPITLYALAH